MKNNNILEIQKRAFDYFQDYTNFDKQSKGYGLTVDHSNRIELASIAATGFMLSSLVIGVENNYIERKDALEKAQLTLHMLYHYAAHHDGFFAHFMNIETAERHNKCEYSTIDTALCLCGVLAVDSYFKDDEISRLTKHIFDRIEWGTLFHLYNERQVLYMSYNPDIDGAYVQGRAGYIHQWDMFAEQLMMYVMIAGSKIDPKTANALYQGFDRMYGTYKDKTYIHAPHNTLFIYHFPLVFLDLRDISDEEGINWFENAKKVTQSHRQASIDAQFLYPWFSKHYFGFNASDTRHGYRVFGGPPNLKNGLDTDGTIAAFSVVGSLPYIQSEAVEAIDELIKVEGFFGSYGFFDAFNPDPIDPWISNRYISIDKGLELLSVDAYLNQSVQKAFMSHPIIIKGMEVLKWEKSKK